MPSAFGRKSQRGLNQWLEYQLVGTATLTYFGWVYSWDTATVPNGSNVLLSEAFCSDRSAFRTGTSITVDNLRNGLTVLDRHAYGAPLSQPPDIWGHPRGSA
jgi:hypothetical protein